MVPKTSPALLETNSISPTSTANASNTTSEIFGFPFCQPDPQIGGYVLHSDKHQSVERVVEACIHIEACKPALELNVFFDQHGQGQPVFKALQKPG